MCINLLSYFNVSFEGAEEFLSTLFILTLKMLNFILNYESVAKLQKG